MSEHGMQVGSSGYGLTHGYGPDDDKDDDNSHEGKHGVGHQESQRKHNQTARKKGASTLFPTHYGTGMAQKKGVGTGGSGWAKWKAKGGGKK
jgi:hypothetical protein